MGPENKNQPQPEQLSQFQPNLRPGGSFVYGNSNNISNRPVFGAESTMSSAPTPKKLNAKKLAMIAGGIITAVIFIIIVINIITPRKTVLSSDEAKEVLTTEKFFNAAKFEGKYRAFVSGNVSPEVLLDNDTYEVLVNGFESYKDIYNSIKAVKTIQLNSETIEVGDIPAKMSKALPIYESVITRYKNFYDSFKLNKEKEIDYSAVTKDAIAEYAQKLENADLEDYYIKFFKYTKEYNDVITNYKTRQCNYNDNEECDMLDEKADSLNKSLENLKQKTTSFFANNKDATFFEDNSVEEKLSDVYLSLSTGMVVENETKD